MSWISRLFSLIERKSWGGEVVEQEDFANKLIITELRNPAGINVAIRSEDQFSATLTPSEVGQLANRLSQFTTKFEHGAKQ